MRNLAAMAARIEDGAIIRFAFFAMLLGTASVLYVDFRQLSEGDATAQMLTPKMPVLPAFDPAGPVSNPGPRVTSDIEALRAPMTIELRNGGVLALTGTIDVGAAARFAAEVEARGDYVKTIALDSPGGSVADALQMGKLIRDKGFATSVAAGAFCASSCPLVFAAGMERTATAASAIGIHQVYADLRQDDTISGLRAAGVAMSDAQKTTASITRYLLEMGVDSAVWLHALDTPPNQLYYLTPEELKTYRLATQLAEA